nr:hypothetical protein CFP56_72831 [Quercus suber]
MVEGLDYGDQLNSKTFDVDALLLGKKKFKIGPILQQLVLILILLRDLFKAKLQEQIEYSQSCMLGRELFNE